MDYKGKLRLAKEALDSGSYDKETIEYIFPELKESEDERIKKDLIRYLNTDMNENPSQSNSFYKKCITWLEKQGEQKPVDKVEPKFKVGDIIINEYGFIMQIDGIDGNMYVYHVLDNNCLLKYDITKTEESCHLWTIQDAKNGDILQANKCTLIFDSLTKDIDDNTVISSWYFCDTKTFYGIGTCKPDLWTIEGVVPATKEECDLLFSKMKEAGYEWDAEEKELKKIEQKSARWNEEDEKRSISAIEHLENSISDTPSSLRPYIRKDIEWLKSLKERMKGE